MIRWRFVVVALLAASCSAAGDASAPKKPPAAASTQASPARSPTPAVAQDVTLALGGDVHFEGRTERRLSGHPRDVLGPIGATLAAADIGMVNLESAITERGRAEPKKYVFRTSPSALIALRDEGVDVVSMANNHAVDYGPVGLRDSLAAIKATGVPLVGIGENAAQAYAPKIITVRGTRVAILAASQVIDSNLRANWIAGDSRAGLASAIDPDRLVAAVRAANDQADVVVVYLHWGQEGNNCPTSNMRTLASTLSAAGADALVGTHAHTLVGDGWLGKTYVAYGLGNFLWYTTSVHKNGSESGVMTLRLKDNAVVAARLTPARIGATGVPLPATGSDATRILNRFSELRACARLSSSPAG